MGRPGKGRLVRGVPLPEESDFWFTWNFPGGFSPNPDFRRYGTEKLVLTVECVLSAYGARHPELARIGVADLALTHGGPFYGRKYGGLGHGSHQNGLDVDVLMPRFDLCECASQSPTEVDAVHAQELVDAFVAAGAQYLFVSPVLTAAASCAARAEWSSRCASTTTTYTCGSGPRPGPPARSRDPGRDAAASRGRRAPCTPTRSAG